MSRLGDIERFYEILGDVQRRLGGLRFLRHCDGRMRWPSRGVYFFFESGQTRSTSGRGPRVVRVGTHALTATSKQTLWARLAQHRGVAKSGSGNHRSSVFGLLVGEAFTRRDHNPLASWGVGKSPGDAARRQGMARSALLKQERATEIAVSSIIGSMPLLWVPVDGPANVDGPRAVIERNAIALLSNFQGDVIDAPSAAWLGLHSASDRVRRSGLWNNQHVDDPYDPSFLGVLAGAVSRTMVAPHPRRASDEG